MSQKKIITYNVTKKKKKPLQKGRACIMISHFIILTSLWSGTEHEQWNVEFIQHST